MKKIKMILVSALLIVGMVSVPVVNAEVAAEAKLDSLTIVDKDTSDSISTSDFDPEEETYTVNVLNSVENVTITVSAIAGAEIDGETTIEKALSEGNNNVTITVKNTDDNTITSTYTITIVRAEAEKPTTPDEGDESNKGDSGDEDDSKDDENNSGLTSEQIKEIANDVKTAIAADADLKGKVELSVYGSSIYFTYKFETLEDGTVFYRDAVVGLSDTIKTADAVIAEAKKVLLAKDSTANTYVELPESNILSKSAMDIIKTISDVFYYSVENAIWAFDTANMNGFDSINLNVYVGEEVEETLRKTVLDLLVDKNKGLVVDFANEGNLPKGTEVAVYVGEKFEDGTTLSLFYYNPKTKQLEEVAKKLEVELGYVTLELDHTSTYVFTVSTNNAATGATNVVLYSGVLLSALALIAVVLKKKAN